MFYVKNTLLKSVNSKRKLHSINLLNNVGYEDSLRSRITITLPFEYIFPEK
jgi:hypothetical protein